MEIIRSIFAFYNLDMAVLNSYPVKNPEEQQVDGDEEVAGADLADNTGLQAGENVCLFRWDLKSPGQEDA